MNRSVLHKRVLWIAETAVMLGLLVAVQGVTAGLGNQFLTGSCVNLILAVTAMVVGLWGGVVVAVASPFLAFLFGIGPKFIQLLPGIALGNLALVLVLHFVMKKTSTRLWPSIAAWLGAAVGKYSVMYLVMVQLLVPALVGGGVIPAKASAALTVQFSWPQFITALIGAGLAMLITPMLKKALKK